ncbi:hypothetical protein HWV62_19213 [Athelia sp. TMB]|nr:hypothetical protein HWV62_19213 [Athelia sp. TMB]
MDLSSLGAAVLLLYEHLLTLDHELKYIWPCVPPPSPLTRADWVWGMMQKTEHGDDEVALPLHPLLLHHHPPVRPPRPAPRIYAHISTLTPARSRSMQIMIRVDTIPPDAGTQRLRHCRGHLVWPLVATQCILSAIELVLVWRVQALYPGRPLYLILGVVVVAEVITLVVDAALLVPGIHYNPICEVHVSIWPIAAYGIIALTAQSAVLAMCVAKRAQLGWTAAPLVSLVMRDGMLAYIAIFGEPPLSPPPLPWLLAALAAVGCRIIMNLQRVKLPGAGPEGTEEATAWHELGSLTTLNTATAATAASTSAPPCTHERRASFFPNHGYV